MENIENLKSIRDVASILKVTPATIHRAIKEYNIPYVIIGRRKFYDPNDFLRNGK